MKLVVFTRDFPPDAGGVQVSMERIARYHGPDAVAIARRWPGDAEFDRRQAYRVKRMPRLDWSHRNRVVHGALRATSALLRFALGGVYVAEAIRAQKSDVVYCAYPFPNGLPMMVVRVLTGCPYVVYCHGTEVFRELARGGVRRAALRAVLRLALRVVVTGEFMAATVAQLVPRDRIVITPLGAESEALDPHAVPAEEIAGVSLAGRRVVMTAGRIEKRKGHDMMARALPEIAARVPEVLWVVAGDGPEREAVAAALRAAGMEGHAVLAGRLSYEDLARLYARADVFAMPNRQIGWDVEGFGIVFLEAALFGVPSVAGNSGGAPQAVRDGETGLLCDGASPADIAAKVTRLLTDRELAARMSEAARRFVAGRTWDEYAATVERVVAPLVTGSGG